MTHAIHAEIFLEVDDLCGYQPEDYISGLERNLRNAIGDGMLTGATPEIEIEEYSTAVLHNPDARTDAVEAYYADAIESGKIQLEDIPKLLARNGLKTVSDFTGEILRQMDRNDEPGLQF